MKADIVVIGSGPGGAITACTLAEGGREVLLVEEGSGKVATCTPFSANEMLCRYRSAGLAYAMGAPGVAYAEGCCVGGGSEVNSGLYHRTPPAVRTIWRGVYGLREFDDADIDPHFAVCEKDLSVSPLGHAAPRASMMLAQGASALGWSAGEVPRWYRSESGGGPVRQSMTRTYLPRAMKSGCQLLTDARVERLSRGRRGGWIAKVVCRDNGGEHRFSIDAQTVFVCGGATQTPALLRRSGIRRNVGNSLNLQPMLKVVALFPEEVNSEGMGVPVHQVKQFAPTLNMGCSISSPAFLALGLLHDPEALKNLPRDWRRMAVYYVNSCGGRGFVRTPLGLKDPVVYYRWSRTDLSILAEGLALLCRLLLAAGAKAIHTSIDGIPPVRSEHELALMPALLPSKGVMLTSVHQCASCPSGEDLSACAVNSFGRVHGFEGLYVGDSSLLPTPVGVNPQGSVMALVHRNALRFLEERRST